ncbi:AAA family ATPase [Oleiagrimonas sp. MCCC 1A03011]|uniref:AAA family ATPase n=1 Tax=Oleiagrimonas sp. MCCC 1A03011 TaxID=1926883 RepID=UPI000DC54D7D|nr:AAA family ATPase [Oleiagrimonas sp. MCCC 1A03011]RAP59821.1 hypothetical protein BTJ49_03205 [Oleiagrimonas sp. MCCC 1A03011]
MSILREIHAWSQKLPKWQQDAIRRLYGMRGINPDDLNDLYALAKVEVGIEDPEDRKPVVLEEADVPTPPVPTRLVQLAAIKGVSNVNALAEGISLPFAPTGLTVVYGENGAGKSGYARILKHACRARDKGEAILPDVRKNPEQVQRAKAVLEALVDGASKEFHWEDRKAAPEPLSDIAIFDTRCAQAYIDNQGDYAYEPYGLDILQNLVTVCNRLKQQATAEKRSNAPSDAGYASLLDQGTAVRKALAAISGKTKKDEIETLASLSREEVEKLDRLTKTLAETDPKKKAQSLRQLATRIEGLKNRIKDAVETVSDQKLAELQSLIDASNKAKSAADLAGRVFRKTPGQLPGTGGEEWKMLFEAAREFSRVSHPEQEFPDLPEEALCPLCQTELNVEGVGNLKRFDAFVQEQVEKDAKEARDKAAEAYKVIKGARLELEIDKALAEQLSEISKPLEESCQAMKKSLTKRQKDLLKASAGEVAWEDVEALPEDPQHALLDVITSLRRDADALDSSVDEEAKAKMVSDHRELEARQKLGEVKLAVFEAIDKHVLCDKLQACIDGMGTTGISMKSTRLSKEQATDELLDALNDELKKLKVHNLQVAMRPESPGGKTQFKLTLQTPGGGAPSDVLSEGEQRAIALASFLAEVRLSKGKGGVVFDDPVSSLDHRRRWEVASRLAAEALERQVIVFTHDIYFLCILEQKVGELNTNFEKRYICKTPAGFGVDSGELPFEVVSSGQRISGLNAQMVGIRKAHKDGDEGEHRRLTKEVYGKLRLAWERTVEEVLLNGVVQRFTEGVYTQKLKRVLVEDDDFRAIEAGMTKSSKFEHDPAAMVGQLPVPDPDELAEDIKALADWRKAVLARQSAVASNR